MRVVVVASDGGRTSTVGDHRRWRVTVVRESKVASDGSRESTAATAPLVTDTTAHSSDDIQEI